MPQDEIRLRIARSHWSGACHDNARIRDEHRSIAAAGLRYLVNEVRKGSVNHLRFCAMVHYIDAFPEKLH